MKMIGLILLATALFSGAAAAQEVTLGRSGSDNVFVWRDSAAQSEAFKLIRAKVHEESPALVFRLMSCMVPGGTKAIITDAGFGSHTILITSGDNAGCRGVIQREDVR